MADLRRKSQGIKMGMGATWLADVPTNHEGNVPGELLSSILKLLMIDVIL